jgi:hypothetical protein
MEKNYITKINGTVTYNSTTTSGDANANIASFCGIDISSPGTNATVQFYGTTPQRLNLFNCEVNSAGLQSALLMNNTGSGSVVVAKDTNFNNTGSGPAAIVDHGKLSLWKTQNNAYGSTLSTKFSNAAQIESTMSLFVGQVEFNNTSGGMMFHPIVMPGSLTCINNNGGDLILSNPVNLGTGALIAGTGSVQYVNTSDTVAYDANVPSDWLATQPIVSTALDELASRIKAIEDGGSGTPSITWYSVFNQMYWDAPAGNDDGSWSTEPEGWSPDSGGFLRLFSIGGWNTGYAPTNIRVTFTGTAADIHLSLYNSGDSQIEDITVLESGVTYPIDLGGNDIFYMDMTQGPTTFFITNIEFDVEPPMGS